MLWKGRKAGVTLSPEAGCAIKSWCPLATLFPPVLRLIQRISANNLSGNGANHVWTKSLNHPSICMLIRNRIWCLKPEMTCWFEAMAWIVFRMSKHEYQINS